MENENLYKLNRIIKLAVEYGREEVYIEMLYDAMEDFLNLICTNNDYIVEESYNRIPQFERDVY